MGRSVVVLRHKRRDGEKIDQYLPRMHAPLGAAAGGCHLRHRGAGRDGAPVARLSRPGRLAPWPVLPRDELDAVSRSVLEAVPARGGWRPARIAVLAGVDFDTVMRGLGQPAAAGFVERSDRGWRARR